MNAYQIINAMERLDDEMLLPVFCMVTDVVTARTRMTAGELFDALLPIIGDVNKELGAWQTE